MPTTRLLHCLCYSIMLALTALAAGCAAPGPGEKQAAEEEAVYVTGSHMARRGKVETAKTMSKEQLEDVQRLNDMPGTK